MVILLKFPLATISVRKAFSFLVFTAVAACLRNINYYKPYFKYFSTLRMSFLHSHLKKRFVYLFSRRELTFLNIIT